LGNLALPAVLPVLVELLADDSPTVQGRALVALRNFSVTPDVLNTIRAFLNATDGVLEAEAALTLAELNDQYSVHHIKTLLSSHFASTRQAASTALSRMPLQ
jgi:HEAT repeat protein